MSDAPIVLRKLFLADGADGGVVVSAPFVDGERFHRLTCRQDRRYSVLFLENRIEEGVHDVLPAIHQDVCLVFFVFRGCVESETAWNVFLGVIGIRLEETFEVACL